MPTPKGTKKKPRAEHEYVYGLGAGIQRFKEGKHGLDHDNHPFERSGMIAYVKNQDFRYWHSKINRWIADAGWPTTENVEVIKLGVIGHLKSRHERKDSPFISLRHFWILVPAKVQ